MLGAELSAMHDTVVVAAVAMVAKENIKTTMLGNKGLGLNSMDFTLYLLKDKLV